jgi:hypothetical protein
MLPARIGAGSEQNTDGTAEKLIPPEAEARSLIRHRQGFLQAQEAESGVIDLQTAN